MNCYICEMVGWLNDHKLWMKNPKADMWKGYVRQNAGWQQKWYSIYKCMLGTQWGGTIEEEFIKKTRQRSSPRIGGQNPWSANCFDWVFFKQMVELIRLFKKDLGKTACAARILFPNPRRRPSPCLLNKSFFNGRHKQEGLKHSYLQSIYADHSHLQVTHESQTNMWGTLTLISTC